MGDPARENIDAAYEASRKLLLGNIDDMPQASGAPKPPRGTQPSASSRRGSRSRNTSGDGQTSDALKQMGSREGSRGPSRAGSRTNSRGSASGGPATAARASDEDDPSAMFQRDEDEGANAFAPTDKAEQGGTQAVQDGRHPSMGPPSTSKGSRSHTPTPTGEENMKENKEAPDHEAHAKAAMMGDTSKLKKAGATPTGEENMKENKGAPDHEAHAKAALMGDTSKLKKAGATTADSAGDGTAEKFTKEVSEGDQKMPAESGNVDPSGSAEATLLGDISNLPKGNKKSAADSEAQSAMLGDISNLKRNNATKRTLSKKEAEEAKRKEAAERKRQLEEEIDYVLEVLDHSGTGYIPLDGCSVLDMFELLGIKDRQEAVRAEAALLNHFPEAKYEIQTGDIRDWWLDKRHAFLEEPADKKSKVYQSAEGVDDSQFQLDQDDGVSAVAYDNRRYENQYNSQEYEDADKLKKGMPSKRKPADEQARAKRLAEQLRDSTSTPFSRLPEVPLFDPYERNVALETAIMDKHHEETKRRELHYACAVGDWELLRELVGFGVGLAASKSKTLKLNPTDPTGKTPLHYAALKGRADVCDFLLSKKKEDGQRIVHIEAIDKHHRTPLHYAAIMGHARVISALYKNGANLHAKDANGDTPLHHASRENHAIATQFLYRECHADVNMHNLYKETPLNISSKNPLVFRQCLEIHEAVREGNFDQVKLVVECGGKNVVSEARRIDGRSAIHMCVELDDEPNGEDSGNSTIKILKYLLDSHADVNMADANGWTPLHIAARLNRLKTMDILLKSGADVHAFSNQGLTPLHIAASNGHEKVILKLMMFNVDTNIRDDEGCTALHWAAKKGHENAVRQLLDKIPVQNAEDDDDDQVVETDLYALNDRRWNALHFACYNNRLDVISFLCTFDTDRKKLKNTADTGNKTPFDVASTPEARHAMDTMHEAAASGRVDLVRKMWKNGQNVNAQSAFKIRTALHYAAIRNQTIVARFLLEKGAKVDIRDIDDRTALHHAAIHEHTEMIELLCSAMASDSGVIGYVDGTDNTALHYAAAGTSVIAIQAILNFGPPLNSYKANADGKLATEIMWYPAVRNSLLVGQLVEEGVKGTWHMPTRGDMVDLAKGATMTLKAGDLVGKHNPNDGEVRFCMVVRPVAPKGHYTVLKEYPSNFEGNLVNISGKRLTKFRSSIRREPIDIPKVGPIYANEWLGLIRRRKLSTVDLQRMQDREMKREQARKAQLGDDPYGEDKAIDVASSADIWTGPAADDGERAYKSMAKYFVTTYGSVIHLRRAFEKVEDRIKHTVKSTDFEKILVSLRLKSRHGDGPLEMPTTEQAQQDAQALAIRYDPKSSGHVQYRALLKDLQKDIKEYAAKVADSIVTRMRQYVEKNRIRVKELFHQFDEDRSLTLSEDEFLKAMEQLGCKDVTKVESHLLANHYDADGNGNISYKEFVDMLKSR